MSRRNHLGEEIERLNVSRVGEHCLLSVSSHRFPRLNVLLLRVMTCFKYLTYYFVVYVLKQIGVIIY